MGIAFIQTFGPFILSTLRTMNGFCDTAPNDGVAVSLALKVPELARGLPPAVALTASAASRRPHIMGLKRLAGKTRDDWQTVAVELHVELHGAEGLPG